MDNKVKKTITLLFALFLAFSVNVSAFAQSFAEERIPSRITSSEALKPMSGTETLYRGTGVIGSFTLVGSNLTPVKTMGASGSFTLYGTAKASSSSFGIRVQIRDYYTGRVLCSTTSDTVVNGTADYQTPVISVSNGQKIQIYMDYISAPSNPAVVSMNYTLF